MITTEHHQCEIHDPIDVENRRKLRSPHAIQLILTLYTFLSALFLKLHYTNCGWKWDLWIDFMLYGSLVWLVYLCLTLVIQFKSISLRKY